jgi:spermidine synthase
MQAGDFNPVNLRTHTAAYTTLKEVFPHVASYRVFVPSFHTEWGFLLASPHHPVERSAEARQEIADTIAARKLELRFYNADVHCGMFCSGMR